MPTMNNVFEADGEHDKTLIVCGNVSSNIDMFYQSDY